MECEVEQSSLDPVKMTATIVFNFALSEGLGNSKLEESGSFSNVLSNTHMFLRLESHPCHCSPIKGRRQLTTPVSVFSPSSICNAFLFKLPRLPFQFPSPFRP